MEREGEKDEDSVYENGTGMMVRPNIVVVQKGVFHALLAFCLWMDIGAQT
jgi:hypothetical protein